MHADQGREGVAIGSEADILPPAGTKNYDQPTVDAAPAAEAIVDDGIDAAKLCTTPPGELMPGLEEPVAPEL